MHAYFVKNCYDLRLEELERWEASHRNKSKHMGTKHNAKYLQGDLKGVEHWFAAQGMKLIFRVWNWMQPSVGSPTKMVDLEKILLIFSFYNPATIIMEGSQWQMD